MCARVQWNVALNYDGDIMRPKGYRLIIIFIDENGVDNGYWDAYYDNTPEALDESDDSL
jgi:hypothetical protein